MAMLNHLVAQVARLHPDHRFWQEMAGAVADSPPPDRGMSNAGTPLALAAGSEAQRSCWCCGRQREPLVNGLCGNCAGLYAAASARIGGGACDCGHSPTARSIYMYDDGRRASSLCSADCVKAHWRELFAFFLRRRS